MSEMVVFAAVITLSTASAQVIGGTEGQPLNLLNVASTAVLGALAVILVRANIDLTNKVIDMVNKIVETKDFIANRNGTTTTTTRIDGQPPPF